MTFHKFAHWTFILGCIVAIAAALLQTVNMFFVFSLVLLGTIVGFMHLKARNVPQFLLACIAMLVAGSAIRNSRRTSRILTSRVFEPDFKSSVQPAPRDELTSLFVKA